MIKNKVNLKVIRLIVTFLLLSFLYIVSGVLAQPPLTCNQPNIQFNSGNYGNEGITLSNTRDYPGDIIASVTCTNGISASVNPSNYPINAKSSATGVVQVSGIASGNDNSGSCTVTTTDGTDPSAKDSCIFNVVVKATECTIPGEKNCSADLTQLETCGNDAMWYPTPCPHGCIQDGTTFKCASQQSSNNYIPIIIIGICIIIGFIILGLILRKKK